MSSKVSINLVVFNGQEYLGHCLDFVKNLNYPHDQIEINIWDNYSTDDTLSIIKSQKENFKDFLGYNFTATTKNIGMWAGQEELLRHSSGQYIVVLSVDIILDKNFLLYTIEAMERDASIGAVQPKIYRFDLDNTRVQTTKIIDTCGFKIFKSRRVINIGHGEEDNHQYDQQKEIFGVEGAVPVFRKEAFESLRINNEVFDHDFFWYAEDFDIAWRMNMFGWKQVFIPKAIAWHDRKTTKSLSDGFSEFRNIRHQIPLAKRRLEFRNIRWAIIKNDYTINILKDMVYIVRRELLMLAYLFLFEPKVLVEIPMMLDKLPKILKKRRQVMRLAKISSERIRTWFN